MIILTLRTDKPESEIGLYDGENKLAYEIWAAHRELAETLHSKVKTLLDTQQLSWQDIAGLAVYEGPGSFTGLRIGISFANALAYSNLVTIAGTTGEHWLEDAIKELIEGNGMKRVVPEYGADAHITQPRK